MPIRFQLTIMMGKPILLNTRLNIMKKITLLLLIIVQIPFTVFGQEEAIKEPEFFQLRDNLYMMTYSYPNIAILLGDKEIFLVDANLKSNIEAVVEAINQRFPDHFIKYLVNTHFHGDHSGGNAFLIKKGTIGIVHENTRSIFDEVYYVDENGKQVEGSTKGKATRSYKKDELPIITYSEKMNLYFGDENIELIHVPNAHTKGDTLVYFRNNNAIALGDNYFGNAYTFGGSVDGMIKAYEEVLSIIDDQTIIIPGHGVHSTKKELTDYLAMVKDVQTQIDKQKKNGKTLEEVKTDKSITEKYDEKYGQLYINGERFRALIYNGSQ